MKTSQITSFLIATLLILSSCREITVQTTINRDGSFTRKFIVTGDSSDVVKQDLPYPVDNSWKKEIRKDSLSKENYILTYTKDYSSSRMLEDELQQEKSWRKKLKRSVKVKKRFGFFYSYLSFAEVYPSANPYNEIPYTDFLDEEDLLRLKANYIPLTPGDSAMTDLAEEKMENYFAFAITDDIIKCLANGIGKLSGGIEDPVNPVQYKDSIMVYTKDWEFDDPIVFIDHLIRWTGDSSYAQLYKMNPPVFEEFNEKIDFFETVLEMEGYQQEVILPGLITSTNSGVVEGNKVSWTVDAQSFLITDYEMLAESRVVNLWAFILSGILLLLMIVLMIMKGRK